MLREISGEITPERMKGCAFLYTNNEETEREIKETSPFTIATKE